MIFRMCLSLYKYQSKGNRYRKRLTYVKNRATINQKHTIDSQKQKKGTQVKIKGNHQTTKRKKKKKGKEGRRNNQLENKI